MPAPRLAVQLYTLRDHLKTPQDIDRTFGRLAEQGWQAVQVSALGPIEPQPLRDLLDKHGLTCCVTHYRPADRLWNDPDGLVQEHETLGCRYTATGGHHPKEGEFTEANWLDFARRFSAAARDLHAKGLRLGYHNHSHELAKVGGKMDVTGRTALELLIDECDPSVWFEIDTYWIQHGGGDPAAWIRRLAGRVPVVHIKDYAVGPDRQPYMAEVGVGNLNWPAILDACREAGVEWYCVEQDVTYRDPFDSLQTSLDNLRSMAPRD